MLPAQRGDVGEQLVGHVDAAAAQMTDSSVEIDGVPERHGRGDEGQAGGAMALVLEGAVAQFAEAVEEDGAGERVAGLALVLLIPYPQYKYGPFLGTFWEQFGNIMFT